ncbi:hypothetical protein C8F04DRAFT_1174651 [Mycena alexandri]|uniref:Uncharacterized protein n=1 Tax=Mycena alexandri TaxID=1745969 RepID=A0AAD6TEV2_9AGAR|nr:hypothetical protein C8F04DRAFT_1174651 [Mycena alexandri]
MIVYCGISTGSAAASRPETLPTARSWPEWRYPALQAKLNPNPTAEIELTTNIALPIFFYSLSFSPISLTSANWKIRTPQPQWTRRAARAAVRREKARLRMAKKRAQLKSRPVEEQMAAAERARLHQATYREKNREELRDWEATRRVQFGVEAYKAYEKQQSQRKRNAQERRIAKAIKAGYLPVGYTLDDSQLITMDASDPAGEEST